MVQMIFAVASTSDNGTIFSVFSFDAESKGDIWAGHHVAIYFGFISKRALCNKWVLLPLLSFCQRIAVR